jgi:tape measure domain-containing protein
MALSIGSIATTFVARTKPFEAGVGRVNKSLRGMSGSFRKQTTSAGAVFQKFTAGIVRQLAILGSALLGIQAIKLVIVATATLEQDLIAIKTFVGSLEEAQALVMEIREFAAATPFQLDDLIKATKILLSFGWTAETVGAQLFMMGNIASALNIPIDELAKIMGKIKAVGKLTGETLNQLQERGVPVLAMLAAHLGITEAAVQSMISQGAISFNMLQQAMWETAGVGGEMSTAMAEQSQALIGLWSTLKDNILELGMLIAVGFADDLKYALRVMIHIVKKLKDWIKVNAVMIKQMVVLVAKWIAFVALWGMFLKMIPLAIKGLALLAKAMRSLAAAQVAMKAASGNITRLLVAAAAAAGAVLAINKIFDEIDRQMQELIDEAAGTFNLELDDTAVDELDAKIKALDTSVGIVLRGTSAEVSARVREKQQRAMEKLLQTIAGNGADAVAVLNQINDKPGAAVAGLI